MFPYSCQFIVKEDGDYSLHTVDPDKLVDWDMIEQIVRASYINIVVILLHYGFDFVYSITSIYTSIEHFICKSWDVGCDHTYTLYK